MPIATVTAPKKFESSPDSAFWSTLFRAPGRCVAISFADVEEVEPVMVGELVAHARHAENTEGIIVLVDVPPELRHFIEVSGLDAEMCVRYKRTPAAKRGTRTQT